MNEPQQISEEEKGPSRTHDGLRLGCNQVGPLPGNRTDLVLTDPQEDPPSIAVVPLAHADQPATAQGMERVGYQDKLRLCEGTARTLK